MTQSATPNREEQALATAKKQFNDVRQLLEQSKDNLKLALPKHIDAGYMIRVALTSVQRTPELLDCHPITLIGALFQAAQLGLVPDGVLGQAYLVPFWNKKKRRKEVQFIPGYKGLVALARRSGEVSTVGAEVVRKKDHFKYAFGINPILEHVPTEEDDPGDIRFVYAFAKLKDGGYQIVVLNVRQVNAIKARSQSAEGDYSPWKSDPEWMFKKTALRQLCKLLPASIELQRAVALDERAEIGLPQDLSLLADASEAPTPDDRDGDNGDQRNVLDEELSTIDEPVQIALRQAFKDLDLSEGQALVRLRQHKGKDWRELLVALQAECYAKLRGTPVVAESSVTTAADVQQPLTAPKGRWGI